MPSSSHFFRSEECVGELKGKKRDGEKAADEDVQATGKCRVGPLEAQPFMRITTCETRTQLIVYSVSLLLFPFFVMHPLPVFPFLAFSLCLFLAGGALDMIDDANVTPVTQLGQLPKWDGS